MNFDACWTCQAPEGHAPDCAYAARTARREALDARVDALLAQWPGSCRCAAEEQVKRDDAQPPAPAGAQQAARPKRRPRRA